MSVLLPNMAVSGCDYLTICGAVEYSTSPNIPASFSGENWLIAHYEQDECEFFIRAGWHDTSNKQGLHIDCIKGSWFDKEGYKKPQPSTEINLIQELIEALNGAKFNCTVRGEFTIAKDQLPPILKLLADNTKFAVGNAEIELTKGTVSVKGLPVIEISWTKIESEKYTIDMKIQGPPTVDGNLFSSSLAAIENVLSFISK